MDTRAGRTRLAAVTLSTFALSLGSVLPATAAPRGPFGPYVYDALGDSYAAGFGTSASPDACGRSEAAYPHFLDGKMRIALDDFAACSGATTTSLADQLGALDADTDLVTLTVGGNDIDWIETLVACLASDDADCAAAVAGSEALITGALPGQLDTAYAGVRTHAPNAHVVVTGYPELFSPRFGDYVVPGTALKASVAEQKMMNDAADLLNSTIEDAAERAGFEYVDVTRFFRSTGVNSPAAWIGGVEDAELFHPTVQGQRMYGVALISSVRPRDLR